MDERREGTDLPVNGDGMAVKPAVSPYGRHVWIGAVLGILSFIGAVWTVIDRWLNRILLDIGGAEVLAGYQVLDAVLTSGAAALVMLALYLCAVKVTESLPDRGAFAALALAEVLHAAGMLGGLVLPGGNTAFYLGAVCVPMAFAMRAAAFWVIFINRENSRDAGGIALAAGCLWLLRAVGAVVTYFATWVLTSGAFDEIWVSIAAFMSNVTLFAAIIGGMLDGLTFLLLRTPVPTTTYPEKNEQL